MKTYEKYKDSEYDWLLKVPNHWQERSIRSICSLSDERNRERAELELLSVYREYGVIRKASRDDNHNMESTNLSNYKYVGADYLVMNKMKMWQGSLGVSKYEGIVSPAYIVCLIRDKKAFPAYINYLLRSAKFKTHYNRISYGIRVGQWDMRYDDFKSLKIYLPDKAEQEQIVRYLDWKVAMADKFVREKKLEIALLRELRQAEINQAVIRSLDPNAPSRPSGIGWIGEIPAHWDFVSLRTLLKPFSEKNHPTKKLLSVTRELGVIIRDCDSKEENHNFIPDDLSGYKLLKKNQFVINKMKAWQGSYGVSLHEGIVSPAYFIFDLITNINPIFFGIAIRSKVYVPFFAQYSDGIRTGQWDLSPKKLKQIPFYLPPIDEQQQIVAHIQTVEERINKAIEDIEKQIALVAEYKTSLISDVTTGKVNIRGIEIPDYEKEVPTSIEEDNEDNNE